MRQEKLTPALSGKRGRRLLLVCLAAALCLSHAAAAQSGRRNTKKVSPSPPPAAAAQADKPPARVSTIIIGGHDIDPDTEEHYSTHVSTVVKACTARLKERPGPALLELKNGGKMTQTEAVERAKRETDAYVLWFGYRTMLVDLHYLTVEYIDYFVLTPRTAKTLTEGRVYPGQQKTTVDPGGVMRLPTVRKRQRIPDTHDELEEGGREIADRVRNKL